MSINNHVKKREKTPLRDSGEKTTETKSARFIPRSLVVMFIVSDWIIKIGPSTETFQLVNRSNLVLKIF